MKKLINLILCLILTVTLFTGCGGDSKQAEKDTSSNPKTEETVKTDDSLKSIFGNAKDIKSVSYTMVTTVDGKQISKGKMWIKENKMKMETSAEGMSVVLYMDGDKKVAYNYIPSEQMATKFDYAQAEAQTQNSPLDYSEEYNKDNLEYKVIGEETVNGYECKVLEIKDPEGDIKVWASKEYGLPIKTESKVDGKLSTMEFSDIQVGDIPDSEFELPAGVEVMDMKEMMNNIPQNIPQQ